MSLLLPLSSHPVSEVLALELGELQVLRGQGFLQVLPRNFFYGMIVGDNQWDYHWEKTVCLLFRSISVLAPLRRYAGTVEYADTPLRRNLGIRRYAVTPEPWNTPIRRYAETLFCANTPIRSSYADTRKPR